MHFWTELWKACVVRTCPPQQLDVISTLTWLVALLRWALLIWIWHPGKIWWRTLDPSNSFMGCAPPMMLLKCCIHILDAGLHEASIAHWWFFHGLWSLMMLLHSVQSNVHSLGNTLLFVPQLQKKYCTLNGCCSVLQTVVGHRQDSPKLHTAWSTLIQNCTQ